MVDIGDEIRFGNPAIDPVTGQPLAAPEPAFTTGGAATDPDAVTLELVKPDQTQLTYGWPTPGADGALTRESAGRFYTDVLIDQSGKWQYRLSGTGAVTAAAEGSMGVQRRRVGI